MPRSETAPVTMAVRADGKVLMGVLLKCKSGRAQVEHQLIGGGAELVSMSFCMATYALLR